MDVAVESGLMPVSEQALEARKRNRVRDELAAHFQLAGAVEPNRETYWVERLDRRPGEGSNWRSGHLVEVRFEDGYVWASCDCVWFLQYWNKRTVCQHIFAAVEMSRRRA